MIFLTKLKVSHNIRSKSLKRENTNQESKKKEKLVSPLSPKLAFCLPPPFTTQTNVIYAQVPLFFKMTDNSCNSVTEQTETFLTE